MLFGVERQQESGLRCVTGVGCGVKKMCWFVNLLVLSLGHQVSLRCFLDVDKARTGILEIHWPLADFFIHWS